jgi:hypothetical protein
LIYYKNYMWLLAWKIRLIAQRSCLNVWGPDKNSQRYSVTNGLENREYGRRCPSRWTRRALYQQKLEPTSPTSGGRSAGIVRSWTQATEFSLFGYKSCKHNLTSSEYFRPQWDITSAKEKKWNSSSSQRQALPTSILRVPNSGRHLQVTWPSFERKYFGFRCDIGQYVKGITIG